MSSRRWLTRSPLAQQGNCAVEHGDGRAQHQQPGQGGHPAERRPGQRQRFAHHRDADHHKVGDAVVAPEDAGAQLGASQGFGVEHILDECQGNEHGQVGVYVPGRGQGAEGGSNVERVGAVIEQPTDGAGVAVASSQRTVGEVADGSKREQNGGQLPPACEDGPGRWPDGDQPEQGEAVCPGQPGTLRWIG